MMLNDEPDDVRDDGLRLRLHTALDPGRFESEIAQLRAQQQRQGLTFTVASAVLSVLIALMLFYTIVLVERESQRSAQLTHLIQANNKTLGILEKATGTQATAASQATLQHIVLQIVNDNRILHHQAPLTFAQFLAER